MLKEHRAFVWGDWICVGAPSHTEGCKDVSIVSLRFITFISVVGVLKFLIKSFPKRRIWPIFTLSSVLQGLVCHMLQQIWMYSVLLNFIFVELGKVDSLIR